MHTIGHLPPTFLWCPPHTLRFQSAIAETVASVKFGGSHLRPGGGMGAALAKSESAVVETVASALVG